MRCALKDPELWKLLRVSTFLSSVLSVLPLDSHRVRKFQSTRPSAPSFSAPMDSRHTVRSKDGFIVLDLLITLAVFVFMVFVMKSHVPSENPGIIVVVPMFTASCFTAVFWLALQMFKAVLAHQRDKSDE